MVSETFTDEHNDSTRVMRGDAARVEYEMFERLYPRLRRLAAVVRPPHLDADDLVHDALVRVLVGGGLARLDNPEAYLRRAIVTIASDRRRSWAAQRRALVRLRGGASPTRDAYASDLGDLHSLSPDDRAAIYMRDIDRLDYGSIAAALGTGEGAARKRVSRARRRLASSITQDEERNHAG